MSWFMDKQERAHEIIDVVREEVGDTTPAQKASLGATGATLTFEWLTGNEALIAGVAGNVLAKTHDIAYTALTAGGVSFAEQTLFGLTAALSIDKLPGAVGNIRRKLSSSKDPDQSANSHPTELELLERPKSDARLRRLGKRAFTAFSIGTSLKVINDNSVEQHSLGHNAKNVVIDAALIAGGVLPIGAVVTGATDLGRAEGFETEAAVFVDVVSSPYFWAFLFVATKARGAYKQRNARRQVQDTTNPTAAADTGLEIQEFPES